MYKRFLSLSSVLVLLSASCGIVAAEASDPASWSDFVDYHRSSGAFGTFAAEGVTQGMWEGIEAGQNYTATYTLQAAEDGRSIRAAHRMETESGEVISIGVGLQYWDERSKSIKSSYSGFDQGNAFSGFSTLKSFDPAANLIEWEYTETSHGKTTRYVQRVEQVSSNRKVQVAKKAEGGDEWKEELTRVQAKQSETRTMPVLQRLLLRGRRK